MDGFTRSLGVGRSHFFGYNPARVDHLLTESDAMAPGVEPRVEVLNDCVYLPQRHALYTTKGIRIDASGPAFLEPGVRPIAAQQEKLDRENREKCPDVLPIPAKLERCDTTMLLMGTIIRQFGHFLTDSMARLWHLDRVAPDMPLLLIGTTRRFQTEYEKTINGSLGLSQRILAPSEPTLFKQVICPRPAIQLSRRVYQGVDKPHRAVARALSEGLQSEIGRKPTYISRSRVAAGLRRVAGEERLEAALEREGYDILHPEQTLTFAGQVALFQSGQPIVGAIGSAFHALLFRISSEPAKIAMLSEDYVHQRFFLQDAVKATDTTYLNCLDRPPALLPGAGGVQVDVKRALERLDAAGFLPNKPARPKRGAASGR